MNILKKLYRKVTSKFNILTIIIGCFTLFFGVSYSYFIITTSNYKASEMYMGTLNYFLSITENNNATVSGTTITVPANYTSTAFVSISSLNTIKSRYKLQYQTSCTACTVRISDASGWNEYGNLKADDSNFDTKKIKIAIVNPTNAQITVTIGASGGYSYNNYNTIANKSGYTAFSTARYVDSSDDIYLSTIAKENLECTPTTSVPCMYGGESARNYVNYNSTIYRILGVYGTSESSYVKMIQSSNLGTQTTFANSAAALTSYFTGLPSSKTDFFTGTTASLISTTEYAAIGYEDSYVNNNTETLTGTTSGSNINYIKTDGTLATKAQSENSYIRPILTLKSDAYINYGGTGSSENPYVISNKVDLIITKITINGSPVTATPTSGNYTLNAICTNGTAIWDNNTKTVDIVMSGIPTVCKLAFTSA